MKNTNAKCGSLTKYVAGCRCGPCRAEAARDARDRRRRKAYGKTIRRPVDLGTREEVRRHMLFLSSEGVGERRLSRLSGVHHSTLRNLRSGKSCCFPETAERILAVGASDKLKLGNARVDAGTSKRLLQEMMAAGFTKLWMGEQVGTGTRLQIKTEQTTVDRARKIQQLHDRLLRERIVSATGKTLGQTCTCRKQRPATTRRCGRSVPVGPVRELLLERYKIRHGRDEFYGWDKMGSDLGVTGRHLIRVAYEVETVSEDLVERICFGLGVYSGPYLGDEAELETA